MPLFNPAAGVLFKSGTYAGDQSVNKAIAHGLGKTPKLVIIRQVYVGSTTRGAYTYIIVQAAYIYYQGGGANSELAVTAPDSTNFYVGNATSYDLSANFAHASVTYHWTAFA